MIFLILLAAANSGAELGEQTPAAPLPGWAIPVISGVIGLVGILIGVIAKGFRGPVEVRDLWTENRALRDELASQRTDFDAKLTAVNEKIDRQRATQRAYNAAFAAGFDAQSRIIERMVQETGQQPTYRTGEHEAIERARNLRLAVDIDDDDITEPEGVPA